MAYAAARQRAVEAADPAAGALLAAPNDILGIEYIRAILENGFPLTPVCVPREGAAHDGGTRGRFAAASAIRELLCAGRTDAARAFLPRQSFGILEREIRAGRAPVDGRALDTAVMSVLRRMDAADFAALPDISEGLEHRLARAAREALDPADFCARVKTRRYSTRGCGVSARLRFWGLRERWRRRPSPYARVLALNDAGRALLRGHGRPRCHESRRWAGSGRRGRAMFGVRGTRGRSVRPRLSQPRRAVRRARLDAEPRLRVRAEL